MKEVLEAHALLVDNMRRNEVRVEEANVEIARMDKELKELKTYYLTVGGDNKAIKTQLDKIQLSTASELGQLLRRIDALSHTIHQHERRLELSHAALAATPTLQRIEHMQQEMAQQLAQMQRENKRGRSISPMPSPSPVRSPRRSSSPEPIPRELSKEEQIEQLKQQLAEKDKANQSKKPRFNGGHKGAGPSGPPKAFERERAPEGSEEEARRQLAFKEKQAQAARKKYEALKAKKN